MVRLQRGIKRVRLNALISFSIPLWCDCNCRKPRRSNTNGKSFQSHYGAIATSTVHVAPKNPILIFQSHYGAIATGGGAACAGAVAKFFNPTMVRLQPTVHVAPRKPAFIFQSHYGAIATRNTCRNIVPEPYFSIPLWCDCNLIILSKRCFSAFSIPLWCDCNSSLNGRSQFNTQCFSIPLWCDCNHHPNMLHAHKNIIFNPTMVRLQRSSGGEGFISIPIFQSHYGAIATRQSC